MYQKFCNKHEKIVKSNRIKFSKSLFAIFSNLPNIEAAFYKQSILDGSLMKKFRDDKPGDRGGHFVAPLLSKHQSGNVPFRQCLSGK